MEDEYLLESIEYAKTVLLKTSSKYMLKKMYGIHDRNNILLNQFKQVYLLYKELSGYTLADQINKIDNIILNLKKVDYE